MCLCVRECVCYLLYIFFCYYIFFLTNKRVYYFCIYFGMMCCWQSLPDNRCDQMLTLERKLLSVMNEICDLLGSVRVDEWLSFPSLLAANIQRLLMQRFLVSFACRYLCKLLLGLRRPTGWAKNRGHKLMTIILSKHDWFSSFFHWKIPW